MNHKVDVKEIIEAIERGEVPLSWCVMGACAKEREFKYLNARWFGKLTPEIRLWQIATEKGVAEMIFPFIKQQSMTMTEEKLTRTILKMTAPLGLSVHA